MTLRTLTKRSLRFHWRSHLGVVIGAAIGSAALIGALIVGDSVKGSLRERALERLGQIKFALDGGDRLFTDTLGKVMPRDLVNGWVESSQGEYLDLRVLFSGGPGTALQVPGIASTPSGEARTGRVHVLGIYQLPPELQNNHYYDFWTYAGWQDAPLIAPGEVWLNDNLASQLRIQPGAEVLLRIQKSSAPSLEVPISPRAVNSVTLRLRFTRIVPSEHLGNFSLREAATPTLNAFVKLEELQKVIGAPGRANILVADGIKQSSDDTFLQSVRRSLDNQASSVAKRLADILPYNHSEERPLAQALADFQEELARHAKLADYEATLRPTPNNNQLELVSSRVFLEPSLVGAAVSRATNGIEHPFKDRNDEEVPKAPFPVTTNAQPLLTYIANLITVGTNATPYSMVTAAGAPWTPPGLRDDEIVLNQWLADDLQAQLGDALTLVYFDPESGARFTERTNTFRVHSIVPMGMPWADRTLMPQFPGIEKAETTAEWDTAFPLVHKIRPQDDDYWTQWRGTPKAFITLAAGQKMWANRFGNLTAIRFPIPTNSVAAGILPAVEPGFQPGGKSVEADQRLDISNSPGTSVAGPDGKMPDATIETFRVALEKKILATLKPEELGLRFEPVREQALKAAEQSQDFGGLFIGFSLFVIVAALLLMALLFQFSLEQRAAEIGTLLALGFTPKQVRRLFLREGAALALLGGILGTLGGIGYARAMLHGLTTLWSDAVGGSALKFHVTPQTLAIGLFASTVVAVFTLWLALRKQARQPARALLTGGMECGDLSPRSKNGLREECVPEFAAHPTAKPSGWSSCWRALLEKRGQVRALQGGLPLAAALGLIVWALASGDTANAGIFFGAGALVLVAGLCLLNSRLARSLPPSSTLHPLSSSTLALRGLTRRRSRSVATAAMLASGTFLIVSISVFRLDANRDATKRTSGTGGFALIGESTMPVVADLNTKAGRESFALNEADFADVSVVQFRVRAGDEASCLNLNRAQKPRLLGVDAHAIWDRFTFVANLNEQTKAGPWGALTHLHTTPGWEKDDVPAIGDAASIQWAMGKKVGDTLDYVDERGQPFKVRIVGAVANSILQGQLIIDEAEFVKRFPGESGYKYFLIDAPTNQIADVSAKLSRALQDVGLELTPAPQRLAQFNAVQNTYLGTFQILGGLGLLLGSAGLGIVVLRNVLERRGELAVLLAIGWQRSNVNQLVLREHLALLGLGLAVGLAAAIVAVLPSLLAPGAEFPWLTLSLTLTAVLANGVIWTWLATRAALRGELLSALRGE